VSNGPVRYNFLYSFSFFTLKNTLNGSELNNLFGAESGANAHSLAMSKRMFIQNAVKWTLARRLNIS